MVCAFWSAVGSIPIETRAPVPIEVWSATELGYPMAGRVAVPVLVRVTVCAGLVVPTACAPKVRLNEETLAAGKRPWSRTAPGVTATSILPSPLKSPATSPASPPFVGKSV